MKKTNKSKDAFVLLIAMAFISLIAMGSTLLLTVSKQKAYTESRRSYTEMARIIAESGVHSAVAAIMRDASLLGSEFEDISVGAGNAVIALTEADPPAGADSADTYYVLSSTGTYGKQTASVGVLLRASSGGGNDSELEELFSGAIFSGGMLSMTGNADIDLAGTGTMHVNNYIYMQGSPSINNAALVSCSGTMTLEGNPRIFSDVIVPSMPTVTGAGDDGVRAFIKGDLSVEVVGEKLIGLDLDPYYTVALENDTPSQSYPNYTYNFVCTDSYISRSELPSWYSEDDVLGVWSKHVFRPEGGVLWVEGNITFGGDCVIEGTVIATGNIFVGGNMTHKNSKGLPAFVSTQGTVTIGSGSTVYGLVYSDKNDIIVKGNATVEGAFICPRGNVYLEGSGGVKYSNSSPLGPNGESVIKWADDGTGSSSGGGGLSGSSGGIEVVRWIK